MGGYVRLGDERFTHHAVSHSEGFVDVRTGAQMHTTEATWKPVKVQLSPYNRKTQYNVKMAEVASGHVVQSGIQLQDSSRYINGTCVNCMLMNLIYKMNVCMFVCTLYKSTFLN